jgi:transposase
VVVGIENEGDPMPKTRKTHPPALKAKVAVEAIKAQRTTSEIAQMFGVHPNLVGSWKKLALDLLPELFAPQAAAARPAVDTEKEELYRQIGQMKVEMDFLKKTIGQLD